MRIINGIQQPQIHFQALLDPAKVSGHYIRLEGAGNDLHGWFNLDDLVLVRVVAHPHPGGEADKWVSV